MRQCFIDTLLEIGVLFIGIEGAMYPYPISLMYTYTVPSPRYALATASTGSV